MATNDDGREAKPETIGFWVVVPVAEHAAAERLAKLYAVEGLEEVGAAFVGVMAEAADRPGSPRVAWLNRWLTSHPWPRSETGGGL
jgi:hypothetical protein